MRLPRLRQRPLAWLSGLLLAVSATAQAGTVVVSEPWARASVAGQRVGAAYLNITSSKAAKLIQAESPAAGVVEIHTMRMREGVMEMRKLESLPLPAAETVQLKPGGLHLMLLDLKAPLVAGQKIDIRLSVQRDGQIELIHVTVPVRGQQ